MDFRDRIKAVINERPELTVRKVSLEAGLSDSALHKLLTGSTKSPTLETLEKLAYALDVDARAAELLSEVFGECQRRRAARRRRRW